MKWHWTGAAVTVLACSLTGFAEESSTCGNALEVPALLPGAALTIESRPAEIDVVGTDRSGLRIVCSVDNAEAAHTVELHYTGLSDSGKLMVEGSSVTHGSVHLRVEVPRRTNLRIHMAAGQVDVDQVAGDADIDLYAGQITIARAPGEPYRSVDASVVIGDVKAEAYGVDKGGFFRSFTREASGGEFRVRAHVLTGQIDLK